MSAAAGGLIRIGETEQADKELARLSQLWPNDPEIFDGELESMIAQRRWADATALLGRASNFPDEFSPAWTATWRDLLSVLQSNDPGARQSMRKSLLASVSSDPQHAVYGLSLLGFVDDAFSVALHEMPVDATDEDAAGFIFSPEAAALRRDPKFMELAARFGLVAYWRRSGKWPDLCLGRRPPFNCAQEAAKVSQSSHG